MPNSSMLCVDATLVIQFVTNAPDEAVRARWRTWREIGQRFIAPNLLRYEVINTLHRFTRSGALPAIGARQSMEAAFSLPVTFHNDLDLHRQALAIAGRLKLPAAYDAHYLALAEREGVEFFTADRRLANSVVGHLNWVRYVGPAPSSSNSR